jgi:hypothetical protein
LLGHKNYIITPKKIKMRRINVENREYSVQVIFMKRSIPHLDENVGDYQILYWLFVKSAVQATRYCLYASVPG